MISNTTKCSSNLLVRIPPQIQVHKPPWQHHLLSRFLPLFAFFVFAFCFFFSCSGWQPPSSQTIALLRQPTKPTNQPTTTTTREKQHVEATTRSHHLSVTPQTNKQKQANKQEKPNSPSSEQAMSMSYAPHKLKPPAGLEELLWGLSKEVLRDQPEDVIKYAAKYFRAAYNQRENPTAPPEKKPVTIQHEEPSPPQSQAQPATDKALPPKPTTLPPMRTEKPQEEPQQQVCPRAFTLMHVSYLLHAGSPLPAAKLNPELVLFFFFRLFPIPPPFSSSTLLLRYCC